MADDQVKPGPPKRRVFSDRAVASAAGRKGGAAGRSEAGPLRLREASPHAAAIGARIRERRHALDQNQEDLAAQLGITNVQLGRYEYGRDQLSAAMLWRLSLVQGAPISFYFQDLPNIPGAAFTRRRPGVRRSP